MFCSFSSLFSPTLCFLDRVGSGYDDRRFLDERFPRDSAYSRGTFHRDVERDAYAAPPPVGLWPQARRRGYEDDYPVEREPRRHDKSYLEPYHDLDNFRDSHRYKILIISEVDKLCDAFFVNDHSDIVDFTGPEDLACVNVMIMFLMIMIIGIVEMIVVREIMIMKDIVMILITIGAEGMAVGGDVIHVIENVTGEI